MCEQSLRIKFEYEGMKTAGVTDYTNQTQVFRKDKISKFNRPKKIRKYLSNVHKIGGAHVPYLNNHYANNENFRMKPFGSTDYTNQTPQSNLQKKCLNSRSQK